ncbi:MAG: flagellar biosynthesis protein FliQ [Gammaproteobacteria bacterium]|nr:flagellar biosynthesis protein FliQ [Gammaproteobacteria bacterium]
MTPESVLDLTQNAMWTAVIVAGPMLMIALAVGLVIGMFQAATQINEMTLSFIPKLFALFLTLVFAGPWLLATLMNYTQNLILSIPSIIG